jgi:hypothetical protein
VQDIARQMANNPGQVLPTLADLAIELCGAVAGGISIYEKDGEVCRWHDLRGTLERFTGATMPRDYSPCGGLSLPIRLAASRSVAQSSTDLRRDLKTAVELQ